MHGHGGGTVRSWFVTSSVTTPHKVRFVRLSAGGSFYEYTEMSSYNIYTVSRARAGRTRVRLETCYTLFLLCLCFLSCYWLPTTYYSIAGRPGCPSLRLLRRYRIALPHADTGCWLHLCPTSRAVQTNMSYLSRESINRSSSVSITVYSNSLSMCCDHRPWKYRILGKVCPSWGTVLIQHIL